MFIVDVRFSLFSAAIKDCIRAVSGEPSPPQLESPTAKQRAGIKRHNNTVLIIDDDQKSLKLASQALIKNGYHVIRETNGTNGLSTALKIKPAAIILDLLLPTINGFEFLQKFRRTDAGKHTPIIVWTVKELTSKDRKILNKSAQAVVQKDGKTNLLVSALQTNLPLSLLKMKS